MIDVSSLSWSSGVVLLLLLQMDDDSHEKHSTNAGRAAQKLCNLIHGQASAAVSGTLWPALHRPSDEFGSTEPARDDALSAEEQGDPPEFQHFTESRTGASAQQRMSIGPHGEHYEIEAKGVLEPAHKPQRNGTLVESRLWLRRRLDEICASEALSAAGK